MSLRNIIERKLTKVEIHAAYRRVFDTDDGKKVLAHILQEGCASKSTFVAGDPHQTSFNEGRRVMALSIARFALRDHSEMLEQLKKALDESIT